MKKILSALLVGAMLICMAPFAGVFAAEDSNSIATADAYNEFVAAINGGTYSGSKNVVITADLDFSGKSYAPIGLLPNGYTIDFGGHALKNINYTDDDGKSSSSDADCLGLIADKVGNSSTIKNIKLVNCTFTVKSNTNGVGGVVGRADRAAVEGVSTDNYTINYEGEGGKVAAMVALQDWEWQNHKITVSGDLKNLTINAPKADVALLVGNFGAFEDSGMHIAIKNVSGNVNITGAKNVVTEDTLYIGGPETTDKEEFTDNTDAIYIDKNSITVTVNNTTAAFKYLSIDSAQEFADFTKAINDGTISPTGTVKITKDLDMRNITDFQPIETLKFVLDFDGHTVSNLVVTTNGTTKDGGTYAGLIAGVMNNGTKILNVSLKNCQLNAKAVHVGIVAGLGDRGVVPNAKIENVTVNAEGAYLVGGVIGDRQWDLADNYDMNAELKNVVINANGATLIGLIAGRLGGDAKINVTGLKAENVAINNNAEGFDASKVSWLGSADTPANATVAEGAKVEITLSETATGYAEPVEEPEAPEPVTPEPEDPKPEPTPGPEDPKPVPGTGDATLVAVVLAVVALIGAAVISKKRSAC